MEELLTTAQAAELKGVCTRTILVAVARGELRPIVLASGRRPYSFRQKDVEAWTPPCERETRRYSDKQLLALLQQAQRQLGHPPSQHDLVRLGTKLPPPSTFAVRFGSWKEAKRLACSGWKNR